MPSTDLPGLRLLRELGRGGTAVVHEALTEPGGERVAVKVVAGGDRVRVLREARAAATVRHPGLVRVRSTGSSPEAVWLVLNLVDGEDLQHQLDRDGPPEPVEAVHLVAQVADAAAALHAAGVVHRDITPANVLVTGGPGARRALLTDFGCADPPPATATDLSRDDAWLHTGTGADLGALPPATGGTWSYMSPEQWRGDPTDARSDVYALGGLLHAALTGHRPYERAGLAELVYAAVVAEPPRPSAVRDGLPAGLDTVVARAMAKDPADRYAGAADLATAARAALSPATDLATAATAATAARPAVDADRGSDADGGSDGVTAVTAAGQPRWRWRWRVTAAVTLLALTGGAAGVLLRDDQPAARVVCARDLTVRDSPGGDTRETLRSGDTFTVQRHSGAWSYGSTASGGSGWVLSDYLGRTC